MKSLRDISHRPAVAPEPPPRPAAVPGPLLNPNGIPVSRRGGVERLRWLHDLNPVGIQAGHRTEQEECGGGRRAATPPGRKWWENHDLGLTGEKLFSTNVVNQWQKEPREAARTRAGHAECGGVE